jgi:hypothetical protein
MTETYFEIDYPCHRWISETGVRSQYADAIANGTANPGCVSINSILCELEAGGEITLRWVDGDWRREERRSIATLKKNN